MKRVGFVTAMSDARTLVAMTALGLNSDAKSPARVADLVTIVIVAPTDVLVLLGPPLWR